MFDSYGTSVMEARASPNLDNTLGALLIGTLLSMSLWGLISAQAYEYFMDHRGSLLECMIVGLLWIVDTFSSALNAHTVYYYMVINYINPKALGSPIWSMSAQPVVTGFSNLVVRAMYARRIYSLSERNKLLVLWIMSLSICEFVVSIVITVQTFQLHQLVQRQTRLHYLAFALSLACNFSLSISLCWLLYSVNGGGPRTDPVVVVLIAYVVNTGFLVAIDTMLIMITYVTLPNTMIAAAFFVLLGKLFVNAYLSCLNAEGKSRKKRSDTSLQLPGLDLSYPNGRQSQSAISTTDERIRMPRRPTLAIKFRTSIEQSADEDRDKSPPGSLNWPSAIPPDHCTK